MCTNNTVVLFIRTQVNPCHSTPCPCTCNVVFVQTHPTLCCSPHATVTSTRAHTHSRLPQTWLNRIPLTQRFFVKHLVKSAAYSRIHTATHRQNKHDSPRQPMHTTRRDSQHRNSPIWGSYPTPNYTLNRSMSYANFSLQLPRETRTTHPGTAAPLRTHYTHA